MESNYWQQRWSEGRIGFHESQPNSYLQKHLARLGEGRKVLVPLCGKSEDLAFLAASNFEVVGVELVESAARAFFSEHHLAAQEAESGKLLRLSANNVTILVGDFFETKPEMLNGCNVFYDRAAMIALPEEMRARYVPHLRSLMPVNAKGLLVSLVYPAAAGEGPPFVVSDEEVKQRFDFAKVERIDDGTSNRGAESKDIVWSIDFQ